MDIQNKIRKFYILFVRNICQIVFQARFLIGIKFNKYETGALQTKFSQIYYFLSSVTDRVEEINRYMGSVNLLPIDIPEETFEVDGIPFNPSKLDCDNPDKGKMTQAVVKML